MLQLKHVFTVATLLLGASLASACVAQPGASGLPSPLPTIATPAAQVSVAPISTVVYGDPSALSPNDRQQEDLNLTPIAAGQLAAKVSQQQAVKLARDFSGSTDVLLLVEHGMAVALPDQPRVSAWLVVFKSSKVIECGPANASFKPVNKCHYTHEGVLVDDQTGQLVRGFAGGSTTPVP